MRNTETITDKELWVLPFNSLMEILEQDAMKKIEGMTRDELDILLNEAVEQRKKKCDMKKIAEQTDEENHECIRLNVLQNAVIEKSQNIWLEEQHPGLYHEMKNRNIKIHDIEQLLSTPEAINGELVDHTPTIDEVIEYMYSVMVEEEKRYA